MANKIKTRFDSSNPNKGKVATLVGVRTPEPIYQDLLEFKVEHNGIEMPLFRLLTNILDEVDANKAIDRRLLEELVLLNQKVKLQQEIILSLEERLKNIEERGNL